MPALTSVQLGAIAIGAVIGGIMLLAITVGCCSCIGETCRQHGGPTQSLSDCFACCGETCNGVISNTFRCLMRQFQNSTGRDPNQAIEITVRRRRRRNTVAPVQTVNPLELFELHAEGTTPAVTGILIPILPAPPTTPTESQSGIPTPMAAPTIQMPTRELDKNTFISQRLFNIIQEIIGMIHNNSDAVKYTNTLTNQEFKTKLTTIVENYLKNTPIALLSLNPEALPKIVVNPDGSIMLGEIADKKLQCFIRAIYSLFVETITVEFNKSQVGSSKNNKILLLGHYRNIIKEGRLKYVNIKGHKVPLNDAKKLDKKQKLNKKK